jgi:hypothetical protein
MYFFFFECCSLVTKDGRCILYCISSLVRVYLVYLGGQGDGVIGHLSLYFFSLNAVHLLQRMQGVASLVKV